jgi:hypothetical protein
MSKPDDALDLQGIIHKNNYGSFTDEEMDVFFDKFIELIESFGYFFGGGIKVTSLEDDENDPKQRNASEELVED